jgi:hypothetical protein
MTKKKLLKNENKKELVNEPSKLKKSTTKVIKSKITITKMKDQIDSDNNNNDAIYIESSDDDNHNDNTNDDKNSNNNNNHIKTNENNKNPIIKSKLKNKNDKKVEVIELSDTEQEDLNDIIEFNMDESVIIKNQFNYSSSNNKKI